MFWIPFFWLDSIGSGSVPLMTILFYHYLFYYVNGFLQQFYYSFSFNKL
nr:MAG: hypothetical protein [Bacteriophage sp.]